MNLMVSTQGNYTFIVLNPQINFIQKKKQNSVRKMHASAMTPRPDKMDGQMKRMG